MPTSQFNERIVLVTGAARGIGLEYARSFAADGAWVALLDADAAELEKAGRALEAAGHKVRCSPIDITDELSVEAAVARISSEWGGVDILINNAGLHLSDYNETTRLPVERWRRILEVNVIGQMLCAKHCRPAMAGRKGASIVNQSSMSAYLGVGAYSVSKLALNGLTVSLAREFAQDGIRVNAIAPGLIATDATESGLDPKIKAGVLAGQLVKRVGSTSDTVATVRFLCSSEASFITGQIFRVDGGSILRPA